jgi:hypothetical protein
MLGHRGTDITELPREIGERPNYYRMKAQECLREAEASSNDANRSEWLKLALVWTRLALNSQSADDAFAVPEAAGGGES